MFGTVVHLYWSYPHKMNYATVANSFRIMIYLLAYFAPFEFTWIRLMLWDTYYKYMLNQRLLVSVTTFFMFANTCLHTTMSWCHFHINCNYLCSTGQFLKTGLVEYIGVLQTPMNYLCWMYSCVMIRYQMSSGPMDQFLDVNSYYPHGDESKIVKWVQYEFLLCKIGPLKWNGAHLKCP